MVHRCLEKRLSQGDKKCDILTLSWWWSIQEFKLDFPNVDVCSLHPIKSVKQYSTNNIV